MKTPEEWAINNQKGLHLIYTHNFTLSGIETKHNREVIDFITRIQKESYDQGVNDTIVNTRKIQTYV